MAQAELIGASSVCDVAVGIVGIVVDGSSLHILKSTLR